MRAAILAVAAIALLGTGCSHIPGLGSKSAASPGSSASHSGSTVAKSTGPLDAQVALPSTFPSDVPIYKNARLTAQASFVSPGQTAWGMEWQTTDGYQDVANYYYYTGFYQGDWERTIASNAATSFSITVTRKSNPHIIGTLTIQNDAGLTRILLSLVSPA